MYNSNICGLQILLYLFIVKLYDPEVFGTFERYPMGQMLQPQFLYAAFITLLHKVLYSLV